MFILKTAPRKQAGYSGSKRLSSATGYRLFSYLRPFWLFMLLAALCLLLASGTHLLFPLVAQQLLDAVFLHHSQDVLNQSTILLLLVLIVGALFSFGQDYLTSYVNERLVTNVRKELHSHLQSLPLAFFHDRRVGDIMSRVTNDVTRMQMGLTTNILNLTQELITLIGSMVIILLLNWRLTLLIALITALILLFSLLFGHPMRRRSKDVQKETGALSSYLEETLSSRRIVKAFVRESYENHRFDRLIEQVFHQSMRLVRARTTYSALTGLFAFSAILVVLWFGGTEVLAGTLSPGQLFAFLVYLVLIAGAVSQLSSSYSKLQESLGSAERVFELLAVPSEPVASPQATPLPSLSGQIAFEHVSFSYVAGTPVLKDLSFVLPSGQTMALVGHSGAGKTTISDLILGFYQPDCGRILIDGYDLRSVDKRMLREQIALVPQELTLFSGTIRENIIYGHLDASESEMKKAAHIAHADEFIEHLPQGYETLVGERGIKLSIGQRQRIAIARAILRNAPILILDEATNSLDNESEVLIQDALYHLMRQRTTLVIAHRLTTIENADQILVLDQGRVIEHGQHASLLAQNGLYARLYHRQFRS